MKAALFSEFATIKNIFLQMMLIYLIVGVIVGLSTGSVVVLAAAIGAMTPIMLLFTLSSYDEMNGWERFRASLPISRSSIVFARYANLLLCTVGTALIAALVGFLVAACAPYLGFLPEKTVIALSEQCDVQLLLLAAFAGCAPILILATFMLPLVMRYGATKALRFIPVVVCIAFLAIVWFVPELESIPWIYSAVHFIVDPNNTLLIMAIVTLGVLTIYTASCFAAVKLYAQKEL